MTTADPNTALRPMSIYEAFIARGMSLVRAEYRSGTLHVWPPADAPAYRVESLRDHGFVVEAVAQ